MTEGMLKILIADDHAIVREGLKQILSEVPDMVVAGEAASGTEAMDLVRREPWSLVLLDISMPGKSGLDVLKQIKDEYPRLPVLMLSMYPEDQYAVRVMKSGASGYLTKESAPELLVTAIRKVANGGKYISPSLAESLACALNSDLDKPLHQTLSNREFEILRLLASGRTVSQIGEQLALSVKTISTYRARILEKLHMESNAELTHYAVKNHLVD